VHGPPDEGGCHYPGEPGRPSRVHNADGRPGQP
jgi:hypothetical protein